MTISQLQVQEFMEFFTGSKHNYGELVYGEKVEGKKRTGSYRTVKDRLITIEEYRKHLEGSVGLGVIPINEDNKCKFAVIDVDIYDTQYTEYIAAIERGGFPLVPFRSKSGGLHVYMFLKTFVKVKTAVNIMRRFTQLLSIELLVKRQTNRTVEIFPKQENLQAESRGSYINLPYYEALEGTQRAITQQGDLDINEALVYIKKKQISIEDAKEFLSIVPFNDAPPCLQSLYLLNPDIEGGRNNYLFSFGVYLKKKDEDFFEQNLQDINITLINPIREKELEITVLSSLRKKDYVYKCKESPCVDYCNKKECKKREFGIGKDEGYFSSVECGKLYQIRTSQPYYEWEVRLQDQDIFKRLRFKTEDDIIKQDTFLRLCMRELHELPSKLKQKEWFNKINQALKDINIINVEQEDDTSPFTMLRSLVNEFLTARAPALTVEQILMGRVYFDEAKQEYLFRKKDLMDFLFLLKKFNRYYQPTEIHGILRELKCEDRRIRVKEGKSQLRVGVFRLEDLNLELELKTFEPDFSNYVEEKF